MKSILSRLCLLLLSVFIASCSFDAPLVTPPSWKGFNYAVKKPVEGGKPGDSTLVIRGDLKPGDPIRVYAVRKNYGVNVGAISGKIHLRCTITEESGRPHIFELDKGVTSLANDAYDGWDDPYATFTLPTITEPYQSIRVEASCQFYFKAFGNQNSEVDLADMSNHEEPYLGYIYTDYMNFDPMNGGSASCNPNGSGGLKYHVIYPN